MQELNFAYKAKVEAIDRAKSLSLFEKDEKKKSFNVQYFFVATADVKSYAEFVSENFFNQTMADTLFTIDEITKRISVCFLDIDEITERNAALLKAYERSFGIIRASINQIYESMHFECNLKDPDIRKRFNESIEVYNRQKSRMKEMSTELYTLSDIVNGYIIREYIHEEEKIPKMVDYFAKLLTSFCIDVYKMMELIDTIISSEKSIAKKYEQSPDEDFDEYSPSRLKSLTKELDKLKL